MYSVKLNTPSFVAQLGAKAEEVMNEAMFALATFAKDRIFRLSGNLSRHNQEIYKSAFGMREEQNSIVLFLEDRPDVILAEEGSPGWSIKKALLKSKNAKQTKDGKPYVDVPFQHRTTARRAPESTRSSTVVPESMRQAVLSAHKAAKASGESQTLFPRAKTRQGDMKVSPEGEATTFRRVSEKTSDSAWQYPQKKGIHAFESTAQQVEMIKNQVIQDVARRHGVGK